MPFVNREPLNKIKEGKDQITGRKLVRYNKSLNRWQPNRCIPRVRSGEEDRVENYYEAKKDNFKGWRLHHRLELTIDNKEAVSMMDLINLGMYYHRPYFELIWLTIDEHNKLHGSTRIIEKNSMYGHTHSEESRKSMSEGHKKLGLVGDKASSWKGDNVTPQGLYVRYKKMYNKGEASLEELENAREIYRKSKRKGPHIWTEDERKEHSLKTKSRWDNYSEDRKLEIGLKISRTKIGVL